MSGGPTGGPGRIRLLVDGPAPGPWNMAVDEALMEAARRGSVTLRLYRWAPPCLSLGRNQRARGAYDEEEAGARGVAIVRRPTGGRAVYHHRELTYAVTAPGELWGGLRSAYARIHRALCRGLAGLSLRVEMAALADGPVPPRRAPPPLARACFREPAPGEVTLLGRKLVGSAQWRHRGALLQHGSILLVDEQRTAEALRLPEASAGAVPGTARRPPAGGGAASPASIGLREACLSPLSLRRLAGGICRGFREEFGLPVVREGEACGEELEAARRLEEVYRSREWTWRR